MAPALVGAQIDDSNSKYKKVHWYIVLASNKRTVADSFQLSLITEKAKYTYKSETPITLQQSTGSPIQMYGTLTFINNADADTLWDSLKTIVLPTQIVYAKLDLSSNAHHWSNDRVPPDIILDQIILGDVNQLAILGIN